MHEINETDYEYKIETDEQDNNFVYKITAEDSPKIIYEPNMEDLSWISHRLYFTTLPNWETISKWYHQLVEPHLEINQEISEKVISLTKGLKSRKEKAAAIFYWVSKNIRYLGVDLEKNRPGFEPHDATYTFDTRGGVCRDKAALLVAMLRKAKIDADVILISSGSRLRPEVPITMFNHAIAVSYDSKGKPDFFFDPTDENTRDFLPKYEEDNSYLIASEKGSTLEFIPVSPADSNRVAIDIDLTIQSDFMATGTVKYNFKGVSETVFRNQLTRFSEQDASNFVSDLVTNLHKSSEMNNFTILNLSDMSKNLNLLVDVSIPNFFNQTNSHFFIPYSCTKLSIDPLYDGYLMRAFRLNERKFDFKLNSTYGVVIKLNLHFPDSSLEEVSFPEVKMIDSYGFHTKIENKIDKKKNDITVTYSFSSSNLHFKKEDFVPIKQTLSKLNTYENLYIIGKVGEKKMKPILLILLILCILPVFADQIDDIIKDTAVNVSLENASALNLYTTVDWKIEEDFSYSKHVFYIKKILTYKGKKRYSDIKLQYYPDYESIELLQHFVISPDGNRLQIPDNQITDMNDRLTLFSPEYVNRNEKNNKFSTNRIWLLYCSGIQS